MVVVIAGLNCSVTSISWVMVVLIVGLNCSVVISIFKAFAGSSHC
jgi:hypothetical protein